MKYFVLLAVVVVASSAIPIESSEDQEDQEFYLVPVGREKR